MLRSISPGLRLLLLAAAFLLSLVVCTVQLSNNQWLAAGAEQAIRYPYLLEEFKTQFAAGIWYPRWIAGLNNGYGYPTFLFNPPGYFYFSLPFAYLAPSADIAAKLSNLACVFLAISGYYCIARILGNRVSVSVLLASFALLNTIWFHAAFNAIGLSQRFAFTFMLWGVFFLLKLAHRIYYGKSYFINVLEFSLLSLAVFITDTQITILYMALVLVLVAGAAARIMDGPRRKIYLVSVTSGLLVAIALSAPYWYPLLSLGDYASLDNAYLDKAAKWFSKNPIPSANILWHWDKPGNSDLGDPVAVLELCLYGLILMSIYYLRTVWWIMPTGILYFLALMLLMPVSLPVWENVPLVAWMQTPPRTTYLLNLIEYLMLSLAASHLFFSHARPFIVYPLLAIVLLLCAVLYHPFSAQHVMGNLPVIQPVNYAQQRQDMNMRGAVTLQSNDEYAPKGSNASALANRYPNHIPAFTLPAGDSTGVVLINLREGLVNEASVTVGETAHLPVRLQLNQLYFPGWSIIVKATPPDSLAASYERSPEGLMQVVIKKPGTYRIIAHYNAPKHWQQRNLAATLAAIITLTLYGCYYARKRYGPPTNEEALT